MRIGIPVTACVVLALATSACGTAAAAPAAGTLPFLTGRQAAAIQAAYDKNNNDINKALNADAVPKIETQPLLASSQAGLKIRKQLQQGPIPPIDHGGGTILVPAATSYPRWFVSVATSDRGGVPSPRPSYTVFTQQAAGAPWLASYDVAPLDTVDAVQTSRAGAASTSVDPDVLIINPNSLTTAIFQHYMDNPAADAFGRTAALDDQLAAGYRTGSQTLAARGSALARTLDTSTYPTYILRTTDGGALAFTTSVVTDTIKSASGKGNVKLQAAGNEAALAGRPNGLTAKQVSIDRLQTFLTYIPTKVSGHKARVLAYTDTPISVSAIL